MLPRDRFLLTFRSEAQDRSAFPRWGCTSRECRLGRLHRAGRDEEPGRGCGCCRAWIARCLALPGDRRERESRRGDACRWGGRASRWGGGPGRIRRGVRGGWGGEGRFGWGLTFVRQRAGARGGGGLGGRGGRCCGGSE